MDEKSITLLVELIRKKGDLLLEGKEKLMVSDLVLKSLNDAFRLVVEEEDDDTSFRVIKTNNSTVEVFRDVEFLHDFIQKVVKLSVAHDVSVTKPDILDISLFRSLRSLELLHIPVQRICGIQSLRSQLQCIVCVHCFYTFRDLLVCCGGDRSSGFLWENLSEIVFINNPLEAIDNSLNYTPWLESVDLSHNNLTSFTAVDCLPNIKYLNLSFNLLESAPVLSKDACRKLEVLVVKNNYIRDISAFAKLENLKHLDISCNYLPDHRALIPLQNLSLLVRLTLLGNPLSFESRHRQRTIKLLHRNAANIKFILDQKQLSWRERRMLRKALVERESQILPANDLEHSVSFSSGSYSINGPLESSLQDSTMPQRSRSGRPGRSGRRVMEAVITESTRDEEEQTDAAVVNEQSPEVGEERQHLAQIRRQVEELRERFGEENWLSQHGASQLHSVLGLPAPSPPPPLTALLQAQIPLSPKSSTRLSPHSSVQSSPRREETKVEVHRADDAIGGEAIENCLVDSDDKLKQDEQNDDNNENEDDEYETDLKTAESEEDISEGQLFTAWRPEDPSELLLLAVGANHLQERELDSGRVRRRWELRVLQSCEQIASTPPTVLLMFDVLQSSRRKQTFQMEPDEAQGFVRMLGDILAARSLSEMNQVPFRCMKCSTVFSHEEDVRSATRDVPVVCPSCGSKIVCMMEETPLPRAQAVGGPTEPVTATIANLPSVLNLSPSQSSIGSDASGGDRLQVAAVVHHAAEAPTASPPQTASPLPALASARSTASLESSTNGPRRCDSDIEVISNPSQSSIEILDGESRTPRRKRSSEERQPAPAPSQQPPQPPPPLALPPSVMVGLTESSSSGSFTDSVCTTYETQTSSSAPPEAEEQTVSRVRHNSGPSGRGTGRKHKEEPIEEATEEPVLYNPGPPATFQEMFDGLLERVDKKLASNSKPLPAAGNEESPIRFSFTDFQCVDHRLKLFLFQHVFEAEGEDVLLLLRADVLLQGQTTVFAGLLVLTSKQMCVLRVTGQEGESPEEWLQKEFSQPLSAVSRVFPLPWAQGVGVLSKGSCLLMLTQDQTHSHNFIAAAASALPSACGVVQECAEYHHLAVRQLVMSEAPSGEGDAPVRLVAVFSQCTAAGHEVFQLSQGALVVTTCDLILTQTDLHWLFPDSKGQKGIEAQAAQTMSNLLEVEVGGSSVRLQFLDEAQAKELTWTLTFQSAGCVETVVAALRGPWEQLFCVPLQVVLSTLPASKSVQSAH